MAKGKRRDKGIEFREINYACARVCVSVSVCVSPTFFCAELPSPCQTAFGVLKKKQRLHGQEQNLAFSPKPSCRPDNVAHMRRNHWLPVKAGEFKWSDHSETQCRKMHIFLCLLQSLYSSIFAVCSTTLPSTAHSLRYLRLIIARNASQ